MPFKRFYGSCPLCPGKTVLIVVKSGFCKFHNEQRKNKGKKPKIKVVKPLKPKKYKPQKKVGPKYGQCTKCEPDTKKLLATKYLCHHHNKEKKKEAKSKRIVKLVNKAEKQKSIPYLVKKLDEIFSLFIRLRDSDSNGSGRCVTCPTVRHYTRMHCGHYITRSAYSLRWDPWNGWIQCEDCNCFKRGEPEIFREEINKRWGSDAAEKLEIKRHFTKKLERFELEFLIQEYTDKVKKLLTEKSFTICLT